MIPDDGQGMRGRVSQSDLTATVVRAAGASPKWPNHGRLPHHGRRLPRVESLFLEARCRAIHCGPKPERPAPRAKQVVGSGGTRCRGWPVIVKIIPTQTVIITTVGDEGAGATDFGGL